ncbi:hypothetical protein PVAP13_6NG157545 [Panicum virgatum]|uniref:Uncharacterized protein n=1 Tax=Panicum virgatum TaxID=38727 RepID=A0A8T0QV56_PANVG|nr:hypothetical protein PVAP13_6NG157545 [Panicum virgatum]
MLGRLAYTILWPLPRCLLYAAASQLRSSGRGTKGAAGPRPRRRGRRAGGDEIEKRRPQSPNTPPPPARLAPCSRRPCGAGSHQLDCLRSCDGRWPRVAAAGAAAPPSL